VEFIETYIFTKRIQEILGDEEYCLLQMDLIKRPDAGNLMPGGKGLRKLRWSIEGKGKRGGIRIIYYWDVPAEQIYMAFVFKKSEQSDLTNNQLKIVLKELMKGNTV